MGRLTLFQTDSPYARLLGKEMTDFLVEENVTGDFLGIFFTPDGRLLEPYTPSMTVAHIASSDLRELAKREDTVVLLAAGGKHKARLMRQILEAKLCNAVITDVHTAMAIFGIEETPDSEWTVQHSAGDELQK